MSRSESLGERLALMKVALDKEPVGIALLSYPELRYTYANPAMVRLLGTNPKGRLHSETATDIPWSLTSKLRKVGEEGKPIKIQDSRWVMPRVPGADPEEMYFTIEVSRVTIGQTTFLLATSVETTDEVQARGKLDTLIDSMNTVLDSVSEAIFSLDEHWRLTYANEPASRYFSRPKDALLHRAFGDLFGEHEARMLEERLRPAMDGRDSVDTELLLPSCGTLTRVRAFPAGRGVAVYLGAIPSPDPSATPRRDGARLQAVMDISHEGLLVLGIGLRCDHVNRVACELLAKKPSELVGKTIPEIFARAMSKAWCIEVTAAIDERRSFRTIAEYDDRGPVEFCGAPFEGGSVLLIRPMRQL